MFISNFRIDTSRVNTQDMSGKFGLTVIYNQNDASAQFLNLPTGGDSVILANGAPLYGSNTLPSYEPLMRLTGSNIDRMGNIWTANNWKPALINDILHNPGGDGIVVFISMARIYT